MLQGQDARSIASIDSTLNQPHQAASKANRRLYFSLFKEEMACSSVDLPWQSLVAFSVR